MTRVSVASCWSTEENGIHQGSGPARKIMGSNLGQNSVITKDNGSWTYCCYVSWSTAIVSTKTGATLNYSLLWLSDKGHVIKG